MILYHGSNIPIDIIDLAKSKPNKDFNFSLERKFQLAILKNYDRRRYKIYD